MSGPPSTPRRVVKPVPPINPEPDLDEIRERARLAGDVTGALENVRKAAENWRTGMAGLITLVTATLLFKGQATIADYDPWVRYGLGGLTLVAFGCAITSVLLFLRAAYGPIGQPTDAQSVIDRGGVDVRNMNLAKDALADIRRARWFAIASVFLLAVGLYLSWYGPTVASEPLAFVRVIVRTESAGEAPETLCGELTAQDGATTVLKVKGEPDPRRIETQGLVSMVLVKEC